MQGVNDTEADIHMHKMVNKVGQAISLPGNSPHQYGRAIDIGGMADAKQVEALLWCYAEFYEEKLVTKILPEKNGCVHWEFSL